MYLQESPKIPSSKRPDVVLTDLLHTLKPEQLIKAHPNLSIRIFQIMAAASSGK
jgi:hypothetical protein